MVFMQQMKMMDFTTLLNDLAQTCRELEQIKADQAKDHERVSKSFEKTLLSILKQEQTILNRVEEEHGRLKDQLSSIQQSNELVLQNGVCEINNMVQEISTVSSQLKQALVTSSDSQLVMKEIQQRISNLFARKNNICINLKRVYFIPQSLPSTTLGVIQCEEQSLGFSTPHCNRKTLVPLVRNSTIQPTLLIDERPPWDVRSHNPDDFGFVGVKILLEDDSDGDCGSSTQSSSLEQNKGDFADQKLGVSLRDKAVVEADSAALSPRTATKKWISDIKQSPLKQGKQHGPISMNQAEEGNKLTRQQPLVSKQLSKDSTLVNKNVNQQVNHFTAGKQQDSKRGSSGFIKDPAGRQQKTVINSKETGTTVDARNSRDNELRHISNDKVSRTSENNSLFRATTAYISEGDSESSEEILEEIETDTIRDPMSCRQVALRESRVPSAKKMIGGDQRTLWMTMESHGQIDRTGGENSPTSYLNRQNLESVHPQSLHRTQLGVDYLRMSDEMSDSLNSELLSVPRPTSPADSVKSTCTFIIEKPKSKGVCKSGTFKVPSSNIQPNESGKAHPIILESESSEVNQRQQALANARHRIVSKLRNKQSQASSSWKPVPRSSSMPYIEKISRPRTAPSRFHRPTSAKERRDSVSSSSSSWSNPRSLGAAAPPGALREIKGRVKSAQYNRKVSKYSQQIPPRKCLSKSESNLTDSPLGNGDGTTKLVRQFGKFGSGRAELNLPHGIHATSTGSVYIVDYGNRRLQVMDSKGKILQQFSLEAKNYFDVAVNNRGLVALTNSTDRTLDVYSKHGRLLQVISRNFGAPRGITANYKDEFIVADMKLGTVCAIMLDSTTGRQKESTVVPGFNKPYLVSTNSQGLLAISERGLDGGCCVKVLREDWQLLKVLGLKGSPGPSLCNPWGVCVDSEGGVLVADWGQKHSIIYYPASKRTQVLVTEGLSSPRGLALLQDGLLLVADSMHNCIKVFKYQEDD
ncbi:uncharacterized protein LOC120921599 [Rana temporaria]|uniref:uncharacterized protein LOC120921599 n=1 Tax=Rana temporaria TaxID=8407 RepID=UPI001AACD133|nr:uncharacterized protein LOC120921599 [Rana temporaria]